MLSIWALCESFGDNGMLHFENGGMVLAVGIDQKSNKDLRDPGNHHPFIIINKHRLLTLFLVHKILSNANGLHISPTPDCELHECRGHGRLKFRTGYCLF